MPVGARALAARYHLSTAKHLHHLYTRNPHRTGLGRFLSKYRDMIGGDISGTRDRDVIYQLGNGMVRADREITAGTKFFKNYATRHKDEDGRVNEEPLLPKRPDLAENTTIPLQVRAPDDIDRLARLAGM